MAFFAVGVVNAKMDRLSQIVVRQPVKLIGLNFVEMFVWLSRSTQAVSHSQVDDQVASAAARMGDRLMRGVNWRVVASLRGGVEPPEAGPALSGFALLAALPEGILLAAVADGAGSAMLGASEPLPREPPSKLCAEASVMKALPTAMMRHVGITRCSRPSGPRGEAVEIEAAAASMAAREWATTLLLLVAAPNLWRRADRRRGGGARGWPGQTSGAHRAEARRIHQ